MRFGGEWEGAGRQGWEGTSNATQNKIGSKIKINEIFDSKKERRKERRNSMSRVS